MSDDQEFLAEFQALLERYHIQFGAFVQTPGGKLHPVSDYLPADWPVLVVPMKEKDNAPTPALPAT